MKRMIAALLLSLAVIFAFSVSSLHAQPTEESLIQAWEQIQKSDPKTISFSKLSDRRYKFKTERYPFDGVLKIKDATVDDMGIGSESEFIVGIVDIDLVGVPKNFIQLHSRKYSIWSRNNMLHYDKKAGRWLTPREFQSVMIKKAEAQSVPSWGVSDFTIIVLVLVGLAIIWKIAQRYGRDSKTALQRQSEALERYEVSLQHSERGLQLAEETNQLLREILESLKNKS